MNVLSRRRCRQIHDGRGESAGIPAPRLPSGQRIAEVATKRRVVATADERAPGCDDVRVRTATNRDFKDASIDQVSAGTIVDVKNVGTGAVTRFTVLGAWDGDPDKHIISYKTAFGAALLGKKPGETVNVKTGASDEHYEIIGIARFAGATAS